VTYWRDLPSLVVAREGESVTKGLLDPRFQEAIDEAAMRLGATGSEAYLEGWTRGDWTPQEGNGPDVCDRVVADLEVDLHRRSLQPPRRHHHRPVHAASLTWGAAGLILRRPGAIFQGGRPRETEVFRVTGAEVGGARRSRPRLLRSVPRRPVLEQRPAIEALHVHARPGTRMGERLGVQRRAGGAGRSRWRRGSSSGLL